MNSSMGDVEMESFGMRVLAELAITNQRRTSDISLLSLYDEYCANISPHIDGTVNSCPSMDTTSPMNLSEDRQPQHQPSADLSTMTRMDTGMLRCIFAK